jgi:hypothetical protein
MFVLVATRFSITELRHDLAIAKHCLDRSRTVKAVTVNEDIILLASFVSIFIDMS